MKKQILPFLLVLLLFSSCLEIEKINDTCEVFIASLEAGLTSYIIDKDIRRNKATGVFTYRDEDGKLWSISLDESGRYWSKSQGQRPVLVQSVVCNGTEYIVTK